MYKEAIKKNSYDFYEKYPNIPEILVLGRSNVGKSSFINSLLDVKVTMPSKTQVRKYIKIIKNKESYYIILIITYYTYHYLG